MSRSAAAVLLVLLVIPSITFAADGVLFLSPSRGSYSIGDVFEAEVRADTDGVDANAAEADLVFNRTALAVQGISTDGSVLSLWPTPPAYSNQTGTIRFSGTAPKSFNSENATLVKIQFKVLSNIPGDVQIESGALLLNDARATNIISTMRSGLYSVVARQAEPAPAPVADVVPEETPAPTPEVKGASVQVPSISGYDDRVSIGERIILQGSAAPNAKLAVFLQHENDTPHESAVLATSDGSFTYVSAEPAEQGLYHAWAEVHTASESLTSDKVAIEASSDGFAAAAESLGSLLTLALPYVLLLIAAGVSLGYFYNRRKAARVQ